MKPVHIKTEFEFEDELGEGDIALEEAWGIRGSVRCSSSVGGCVAEVPYSLKQEVVGAGRDPLRRGPCALLPTGGRRGGPQIGYGYETKTKFDEFRYCI